MQPVGDWSGQIFAAQDKACDAPAPGRRPGASFEKGASLA